MLRVMPRAALHAKYFDCGDELRWQGGDGKRHRNKGEHDSGVHRRAALRFARHLRRRDLGGLAVRPAEAARDGSRGV